MSEGMYKRVVFHGVLNERTGYGIHATRFAEKLSKIIPVVLNEYQPAEGDVHISMVDSVSIENINERFPYPSILYNVWESTEQPQWFIDRLKYFDQFWVPSEWQRAASIAQGIPEEFVKVVPEGVDQETYFPITIIDRPIPDTFNFLHVGQWQPRKSTMEICQSFLKAFPDNPNVRLYLSADTLFPSDNYKSTEERLNAYGLNDSRIIPIHFEEREAYIRRLQSADVFVSCARSEGWGLPIIEAMACGIPTIVADWSGSTEYAYDALTVRIRELIKPFGIYGNWDVPGKWAEPDFDHLVEVMRNTYGNYASHKEKALKTSEMIRTKFSWEAAAKKAFEIIQELKSSPFVRRCITIPETASPEQAVREYARKMGYEIIGLKPSRKAIFTIECWPNSQEKMDTLTETIKQVHEQGYPVLVTSHYPLPAPVTELCDFYIYEKQDNMSGDDKPIYWRRKADGTTETKQAGVEYQGCAALNCFRNAIDFCRGKYDWIYDMAADMEVDLPEWLSLVHASEKSMVCIPYEGKKDGIGGGLWAGKTEVLDKVIPYLPNWKTYAEMFPDVRFVAERWIFNYVSTKCDVEKEIDWITIDTKNRFDNVDRNVWKDDEFQCNFMEGPFLNIVGLSNREYDVTFGNPIDGENVYALKQKPGVWSRPAIKFYRDWTVTAKLDGVVKYQHKLSLEGKNVIISAGSKALGDTIAWMPYIEEFRKKHKCNVYCSTWWNNIMDYPEIHFIKPGDVVEGVYASYDVGCFDGQLDRNVADWRLTPLQKVAADILGIDYEPLRTRLKYEPKKSGNGKEPKPYICFSEFSTMRNKLWNREGAWQKIIDYLVSIGYDCVAISAEQTQLNNVIRHNGQSIEQTLTDLSGAKFYVGLNAGPTWLAYAIGLPVCMITGVSAEFNDFPNPYRVSVNSCIPGCFNDPSIPIDRGFEWCPRKRDYACTKDITETMVIEMIEKLIRDLSVSPTHGKRSRGKRRQEALSSHDGA